MKSLLLILLSASAVLALPGDGIADSVSQDSTIIPNDVVSSASIEKNPGQEEVQGAGIDISGKNGMTSRIVNVDPAFPHEIKSSGAKGYCYVTQCHNGQQDWHHEYCRTGWINK
ncbi:hypothetical protein BZA77DRAFT_387857, partial [Pyronema omphalodes]